MLDKWMQHVDELRNQYHWLLFFSMPKILRLYHLLLERNPNVKSIVREISFLCRNDLAAWENAQVVVEVSSGWNKTGLGDMQPRIVGILEPLGSMLSFSLPKLAHITILYCVSLTLSLEWWKRKGDGDRDRIEMLK